MNESDQHFRGSIQQVDFTDGHLADLGLAGLVLTSL